MAGMSHLLSACYRSSRKAAREKPFHWEVTAQMLNAAMTAESSIQTRFFFASCARPSDAADDLIWFSFSFIRKPAARRSTQAPP